MPELTRTFVQYEEPLRAAGLWWPEDDVRLACAAVDATRVALSAKILDRWLAQNPAAFAATAAALVAVRSRPPLTLLVDVLGLKHDLFLAGVSDPALAPVEEMAGSLRPVLQTDPLLAVRLMKLLLNGIPEAGVTFPEPMLERGMDLIAATETLERVRIYLVQLSRHHDRRIRSKAALLVAKTNQNVKFIYERYTREADARVRANLIEGLWKVKSPDKAEVYWKAARDVNHRVMANALVGLCEMGDGDAIARLKEMAAHPDPSMRAAAAWAMGRMADPQYCDVLTRLFREDQGGPRRNALRALVRIRQAAQETESEAVLPASA